MSSSSMDLNSDNTVSAMGFSGELKKWTNYISGWQNRFFVLKQGFLLYYKSENDIEFGCRGAINLSNASVESHKFDDCRFDVRICDLIWYLRSESPEERREWEDALKLHTKRLKKSADSLYPAVFCLTLREKLKDVDSSRERLSELAEILLKRLENPQQSYPGNKPNLDHNPSSICAEISCFKDATSDLSAMLYSCVDLIEARRKFLINGRESSNTSMASCSSNRPEMVEGPHCQLGEDKFFDAVEFSLERIEEEAEMRKAMNPLTLTEAPLSGEPLAKHPLWSKISQKTEEQIKLVTTGLQESSWDLLLNEQDMKIYSKETEVDGLVIDPLMAVCTVKGVTGREVCHHFFCPQYRQDWEPSIEQMRVMERIGQSVIIFHQVYKRVWPTAQRIFSISRPYRDTLFWSHLVQCAKPGCPDAWAVVNDSLDLPQVPANDGKLVRVTFTACLYCVTETARSPPYTRDDVTCRLTYSTIVNPGGWVPASAVRALRRKEYPKFLKKLTSYVVRKTADTDIMM